MPYYSDFYIINGHILHKKGRHHPDASPILVLVTSLLASLVLERAVTHATCGRNRCQKGRERGYYYLHRHLNNPLFHTHLSLTFIMSGRSARTMGTGTDVLSLMAQCVPVPSVASLSRLNPDPDRHLRRHQYYRY